MENNTMGEAKIYLKSGNLHVVKNVSSVQYPENVYGVITDRKKFKLPDQSIEITFVSENESCTVRSSDIEFVHFFD